MEVFQNRQQAGQKLASLLLSHKHKPNTIILALPRGGVPVGFELAQTLELPIDVFLVRKLRVPGQEELAMGAVAINDICVFNKDIIEALQIPQELIHQEIDKQKAIIAVRNQLYRANRPAPDLTGKTVILVDDGIATGATLRAAVNAIKLQTPNQVIIATPVAAVDSCNTLAHEVDEIICLQTPEPFHGVGYWYKDFSEVSDAKVIELLNQADFYNMKVKYVD